VCYQKAKRQSGDWRSRAYGTLLPSNYYTSGANFCQEKNGAGIYDTQRYDT